MALGVVHYVICVEEGAVKETGAKEAWENLTIELIKFLGRN